MEPVRETKQIKPIELKHLEPVIHVEKVDSSAIESAQNANNRAVTFEFKIEGMTCVSCSSAIEKGLTYAFKNRGLLIDPSKEHAGVQVALLMHKMRISFHQSLVEMNGISAEAIIQEVEDLGFSATLLNRYELIEERDPSMNQSSTSKHIQS